MYSLAGLAKKQWLHYNISQHIRKSSGIPKFPADSNCSISHTTKIQHMCNSHVFDYPFAFQGHSRRGSCLIHLRRNKEAVRAFCKAHVHAVSNKEKQVTAQEVISAAMKFEGW